MLKLDWNTPKGWSFLGGYVFGTLLVVGMCCAQQQGFDDPNEEDPPSSLADEAFERTGNLQGSCSDFLWFHYPDWEAMHDEQELYILGVLVPAWSNTDNPDTPEFDPDPGIDFCIQAALVENDVIADHIWQMLGCALDDNAKAQMDVDRAWDHCDAQEYQAALDDCDEADLHLADRANEETTAAIGWQNAEDWIYEAELALAEYDLYPER